MVLPLRTDIAYSGAGGKLTQAGVEAIQGQFNAQAATSAATAAQVATNTADITTLQAARDLFYRSDAALSGANVTTAQDVFALDVTLTASTVYEYELAYSLVKTVGATGHNVRVFFGGTATFNNAYRSLLGTSAVGAGVFLTGVIGALGYTATMSDNVNISGTLSNANSMVHLVERGTFSVNGAGTVIPQYILSAAPGGAYSVSAGAMFKLRRLGASGADVSFGPWA